jgi:hypothetical protein
MASYDAPANSVSVPVKIEEKSPYLLLRPRWGWRHHRYRRSCDCARRGFLKRISSISLWPMRRAICATRRMHRQPFHSRCRSCFPIHSANCAPFALLSRGLARPERERSVFLVLVRSLTKFFAPSYNHSGRFDEAAELISCTESNWLKTGGL